MIAVRTKYAEYRAKVNRFLFGGPFDASMKSIRQEMVYIKYVMNAVVEVNPPEG